MRKVAVAVPVDGVQAPAAFDIERHLACGILTAEGVFGFYICRKVTVEDIKRNVDMATIIINGTYIVRTSRQVFLCVVIILLAIPEVSVRAYVGG